MNNRRPDGRETNAKASGVRRFDMPKYTFAPVERKEKRTEPRKIPARITPVQVGMYFVYIFWLGLLPVKLWSMLFRCPGDTFLAVYFGLLTILYFGWFRLALIVFTLVLFLWLY